MVILQDLQDQIALHPARHLLRESLERDLAVFGNLVREMKRLLLVFRAFQMKCFFGAENHVTRETGLQLADVAGPGALLQELQHFARHRARVTLIAVVELLPQILDEIWNIVTTLAQWRKRDTDHVDAIEKVGPEPARFDFAPQLSVG